MSLYEAIKAFLRPTTTLFFDATVRGEENVPAEGGLVVAANHRSFLDPPLLGTWFPRTIHFMAKRELFTYPILGPLINAVHAFPVDRTTADIGSFRRALRVLKEGGVVGMFPEGRRNYAGDAKVRGGAVLLAATAHVPLVPVALLRADIAMRRLRGSHVEVRIGKPMIFQGSNRKATKAEIEEWTNELAQAIEQLMSGE